MAVELRCDRCGAAIFSSRTNIPSKSSAAIRAKIFDGVYADRRTIDLCKACGEALEVWLREGKSG